jgi:hypothetical protein
VIQGPGGAQVVDSTAFVDADRGFWVLPRVSGDRVTLEMSTANDRVQSRRGNTLGSREIGTQRVDTIVSGRLGEWIEIGAVAEHARQQEQVVLGRESASRSDRHAVVLKVEEVQ